MNQSTLPKDYPMPRIVSHGIKEIPILALGLNGISTPKTFTVAVYEAYPTANANKLKGLHPSLELITKNRKIPKVFAGVQWTIVFSRHRVNGEAGENQILSLMQHNGFEINFGSDSETVMDIVKGVNDGLPDKFQGWTSKRTSGPGSCPIIWTINSRFR